MRRLTSNNLPSIYSTLAKKNPYRTYSNYKNGCNYGFCPRKFAVHHKTCYSHCSVGLFRVACRDMRHCKMRNANKKLQTHTIPSHYALTLKRGRNPDHCDPPRCVFVRLHVQIHGLQCVCVCVCVCVCLNTLTASLRCSFYWRWSYRDQSTVVIPQYSHES